MASDNTASYVGGGFHVNNSVTFTMNKSSVLRNAAADAGGAAWIESESLFAVTECDFGTGDTDNTPEDIWTDLGNPYAYGAGATFTCDDGACVP